ncbi:MAG: 1,4-alpha-glucan branching protein GlgB [Marinagarivorans sp.]|nr:1,4-alpha-glucan branching protein GlgB [Marinagarivorans sp.]
MISAAELDSVVYAYHGDIFAVLGPHQMLNGNYAVRVFLPEAISVSIIERGSNRLIKPLNRIHPAGVFEAEVALGSRSAYLLEVEYENGKKIAEDTYRFPSMLNPTDVYLFGEGTHEKLYQWLGSHLKEIDGVRGTLFTVWAPNANRVSVVGEFNFWDGRHHVMRKHVASGLWELFIPGVAENALYKYQILSKNHGVLPLKADPMAFAAQLRPETASRVIAQSQYAWGDNSWTSRKVEQGYRDQAVSVYEVHLGSWKRKGDHGNDYYSYLDMVDELIPYVKAMGFTHIQLMPVSEYPFDGSWGYQPIGLYAPTSRFGSPDEFRQFIDCCHQQEIGVLVDWVPGHFPSDGHGLAFFDGSPLYEHADPRQGFHPDWNTYIYNYGRSEVANYLFSNALFWFDQFHIDGLRVDAVASMLYLDYSRESGEWVPNIHGGRENLEAIALLKRVNQKVYEHYPNAMMVAEESTAWPGVSHPVYAGGLGFGYKWNMGWMNDSLRYMSNDPIHRRYHHHDMTFSLLYAFNENFVLPLSHDEVVHGKGSLLDKMPGDAWQKFANLRAYYGFMWGHPGKKLLFMGCEFAQGREWNCNTSLDWHLLENAHWHVGVQRLVRDLNNLYTSLPALHFDDCEARGFEWLDADGTGTSVFAFARKAHSGFVVVVSNMTPVLRSGYRIGVPEAGFYRERVNTDAAIYGGSDKGNSGGIFAESISSHGRNQSIFITLPPLATLFFEWHAE